MELRHLRYFVAVAATGNVSQAARKLRVAQPALSRQIRDLEQELGAPLLERSARGVRLTDLGKHFAVEAREVLARAEAAFESARAIARGAGGDLHLGYAPSPTAELLPRALHAFQNVAPDVRIALHDASSQEMLSGLEEGTLHAALLVQPCADRLGQLTFEEVQSYPIQVALWPSHPLVRQSQIALTRLRQETLVVYARSDYGEYHALLDSIFATAGGAPRIAQECDSVTSLIAAVEAKRGVAIVPSVLRCLAGPRLKLRPLRPAPPQLVVGFALNPARSTPAARLFLDTVRSLRRELPG